MGGVSGGEHLSNPFLDLLLDRLQEQVQAGGVKAIFQFLEEVELCWFGAQECCDHREETERTIRCTVGGSALPVLFNESHEDSTNLVGRKLEICGVHRCQFL